MPQMKTYPADEKLPHVNIAASTEKIREVFAQKIPHFTTGDWRVYDVAIKQMQYRPGKKFEANYVIHFENTKNNEKGRQFYSTLMLPKKAAAHKYQTERERDYLQPPVAPGLFFLEDVDMIMWGFPNDPKIKNLLDVLLPQRLQERFERFREQFEIPEGAQIKKVKTNMAKYVPRDRCTMSHKIKYELAGKNQEMTIFSKTYSVKFSGEPLFNLLRQLWESEVCQSGKMLIPKPLFYDKQTNTTYMSALSGEHYSDKLEEIDLPQVAAQCGAGLTDLQQTELSVFEQRSLRGELREYDEGMQVLIKYDETLQPRLQNLRQKLSESLENLPQLEKTPNHGAFRLTQLLDVDGTPGLLDFDGFLLADPLVDVASFVTHLFYLVVKGEIDLETCEKATKAFCSAYAEKAPSGLPENALRWHAVVALVGKQAKKCVRLAKDGQGDRIEQMIHRAEEIFEGKQALV